MKHHPRTRIAVAAVTALALTAGVQSAAAYEAPAYHSPAESGDGQTVLFAGYAAGKGIELFKTDGTDGGTKLVKDIYPGSASGLPSEDLSRNASDFTAVGAKTFFTATDHTGRQLWVTDGTAAGTVRLTSTIDTGSVGVGVRPEGITAFGDKVFFMGWSKAEGAELWSSDGTVAGTTMVANIGNTKGSSFPDELTVVGDQLYFIAGKKLRVTDGTTVQTIDLGIDPAEGSFVGDLEDTMIEVDGKLVFSLVSGFSQQNLWVTDGTAAGTAELADNFGLDYRPTGRLKGFDGAAFSIGYPGVLWSVGVHDGAPVQVSALPVSDFAVAGDKLWFTTYDKATKLNSLWMLSSATEEPVKVSDINKSAYPMDEFDAVSLNGVMYAYIRGALYRSDGTAEGSYFVENFGIGGFGAEIARAGDKIVITSHLGTMASSRLFLSDGTAKGTYQRMPQRSFTTAPTPLVKGSAVEGETLRGYVGSWAPVGAAFTYSWSADGVAIPGATAKNFTVTAEQAGKALTLTVTGYLPGFKKLAKKSAPTLPVVRVFSSAPIPQIGGVLAAGQTLTANPGTWSPSATLSYQWFADGVAIKGKSTSATYVATSTSALKSITVRVTATRPGYQTTARLSAPASGAA